MSRITKVGRGTAFLAVGISLALFLISGCAPKTDAPQESAGEAASDAVAPEGGASAETAADNAAGKASEEAADGETSVVGSDAYLAFIESAPVVVVDFTATWCGPCGRLAPILKKMEASYEKDGVKFAKVDVDQNKALCDTLKVQGIPDVRIYVQGKSFGAVVGCQPQEIMMKLEEAVKTVKEGTAPLPPLPEGPLPTEPVPAPETAPAEEVPAPAPAEAPTEPAPADTPLELPLEIPAEAPAAPAPAPAEAPAPAPAP